MIGYKVFDEYDCQFKVGQVINRFDNDGNGYYFCTTPASCFSYYEFNPNNRVVMIEALSGVTEVYDFTYYADTIGIVCELTWSEVLKLATPTPAAKPSKRRMINISNKDNKLLKWLFQY